MFSYFRHSAASLLWLLTAISITQQTLPAQATSDRPNIVVMLADDLGFSDLGCYGSEIDTPNLDRMAEQGVRFSHFRATPMCVTSRIAMMAGMPMQRAGAHAYTHSLPLPMLLKEAGYRTLMTGKWHAGTPDPRSRKLFDRSFGFLSGMTDSFIGADDWFLDDKPFSNFGDGFYSTDAFADRSIAFMKESVSQNQPFFMYVSFNAPHHPCQAPKETFDKYPGRYRSGYESIRQTRHAKQVELGIIDPTLKMGPLGSEVRPWNQLNEQRQTIEAHRMAAYAAAVDRVDIAAGRILSYLDENNLSEKTLVVFMSDNGGDYNNGAIDTDARQQAWKPHHNPTSSNGWAAVKATPFRFYKHSCHEGGIAVPMIAKWPGKIPAGATSTANGSIVHTPASIVDLYPTCLEVAGIEYPKQFEGRPLRTLTGQSLLACLENRLPYESPNADSSLRRDGLFQHYDYSRAWIQDEWKAVSLYGGPWQLFNLNNDRGELIDLSTQHPERLARLSTRWTEFASQSGMAVEGQRVADQKGWGWHRLKMTSPALRKLKPANGSIIQTDDFQIQMRFEGKVDFANTANKTIRLYCYPDETNPIWQSDPDKDHPSQGENTFTGQQLPELKPGKQYYFRWDPGWIRVNGRSAGPLNEGAYWWRFRTDNQPFNVPSE